MIKNLGSQSLSAVFSRTTLASINFATPISLSCFTAAYKGADRGGGGGGRSVGGGGAWEGEGLCWDVLQQCQ